MYINCWYYFKGVSSFWSYVWLYNCGINYSNLAEWRKHGKLKLKIFCIQYDLFFYLFSLFASVLSLCVLLASPTYSRRTAAISVFSRHIFHPGWSRCCTNQACIAVVSAVIFRTTTRRYLSFMIFLRILSSRIASSVFSLLLLVLLLVLLWFPFVL